MNKTTNTGERGSARLKLIIFLAVIAIVGYSAYLYIPVAYQAYLFKDLMNHNVNVAVTQGYPPQWVKDQLAKAAPEYDVPPEAIIDPTLRENRIEVTVKFTRPIEFPGYTYEYNFDYTARSTAFLTFK